MPLLLIGGMASFFVVAFLCGQSPNALQDAGWLLGPFPDIAPWKPLTLAAFQNASWPIIFENAGNIATILLITIVSVLLNSGALELVVKKDINLNRELKAAGIANIIIGLGGGTVWF